MGGYILRHLRHLDVGFVSPGGARATKGASVLCIKDNMSWVHTVVIQVGFYLLIQSIGTITL